MNELLHTKAGMAAILAIAVLLVFWGLERRNRNAGSAINLDDLLIGDDGKISKAAAVMMGSFALTTWVMIYLTLESKLTEGYFAAYLAGWVAPAVTKLIVNAPPATTQQTTITQTTVTPPQDK